MKRTVFEATKDGQVKMQREELLQPMRFRDGIGEGSSTQWFPLLNERRIAKTPEMLLKYLRLRPEQYGDVPKQFCPKCKGLIVFYVLAESVELLKLGPRDVKLTCERMALVVPDWLKDDQKRKRRERKAVQFALLYSRSSHKQPKEGTLQAPTAPTELPVSLSVNLGDLERYEALMLKHTEELLDVIGVPRYSNGTFAELTYEQRIDWIRERLS